MYAITTTSPYITRCVSMYSIRKARVSVCKRSTITQKTVVGRNIECIDRGWTSKIGREFLSTSVCYVKGVKVRREFLRTSIVSDKTVLLYAGGICNSGVAFYLPNHLAAQTHQQQLEAHQYQARTDILAVGSLGPV